MKPAVSLLLVSMLIGSGAALAAAAIGSLTSATLSPIGGALLGVALGLTGGGGAAQPTASGRVGTALVRALVAGGTAAVVIALLQR